MSFSSLKKSTHSVRPKLVTVDQFIDDAVSYANGTNVKPITSNLLKVVAEAANEKAKTMKRATFTLNEATIDGLAELSENTGISKSRILRILVQQQLKRGEDSNLLDSDLQ
jgi:predicted DNA-binding protein